MQGKLTLLAWVSSLAGTVMATAFYIKNNQLDDLSSQNQALRGQLQEQLETSQSDILVYLAQITQLEENLMSANNLLDSLVAESQQGRGNVNPDLEAILRQIQSQQLPDTRQSGDNSVNNTAAQFRRAYQVQIAMSAPDLTTANQRRLLDQLYIELVEKQDDLDFTSIIDLNNAVNADDPGLASSKQLEAISRVRQSISKNMSSGQLQEAENFLSNLESTVNLSRAMNQQLDLH